MEKQLILVNENDEIIGYGEKMYVHKEEKLHRAFSLFIYDESSHSMLIHKRAIGKYHSGGLWTNACCSHPIKGEKLWKSVIRRAKEELGIEIPEGDYKSGNFFEIGKFHYYKKYDDCAENEIDHVFVWKISGTNLNFWPNENEIEDIRWIYLFDLEDWMLNKPNDFTAWFFEGYELFVDKLII